jgi:hypothetical protein
MALDETTRQMNQRALDALSTASWWLLEADREVTYAVWPLEALSEVTNAHDAALEELNAVSARIKSAREDVMRRWRAESEGER